MDNLLITLDSALRTLFVPASAHRPCPEAQSQDRTEEHMSEEDKRHAAGLMRVNHTGEICAQALYTAQAMVTQNTGLKAHFLHAAEEETDHLAWTEQRIKALGGRTSILNPLWYAGAFAIGAVAGKWGGDRTSLAFVVETENQVEAHLDSHLTLSETGRGGLPTQDSASRAIVQQMKEDEMRHASEARNAGAGLLPQPVRYLMRGAAKIMTTLAYRV